MNNCDKCKKTEKNTLYCGYVKPQVGDIVELSTCDIGYHNVYENSYTSSVNDDEVFAEVVLELIDYDDSEYIPGKGRNGGSYLFSTWRILEIGRIMTFRELMSQP